jgi:hypothetical protein
MESDKESARINAVTLVTNSDSQQKLRNRSAATETNAQPGEASRAPLSPLFEHAHLTTVDVNAGDALLLPAFWYHEVDSFCDGPAELNLAVNCWWHCGSAISTRHRILREQLRANPQ